MSSGLRVRSNAGMAVKGMPSDMVFLITSSLFPPSLSGVKAPPIPYRPWRFSPWHVAHLVAYRALTSVREEAGGSDGAGTAAGTTGGGALLPQETSNNPVASRDTQSTILFTNIVLVSTQLESEAGHDKDNRQLEYPLHATELGVSHAQPGNLLNVRPVGE